MFRIIRFFAARAVAAAALALALALAWSGPAQAQTIFVVHAADTDDPSIGADCRIDQANIRRLFAAYPDLDRITRFVPLAGRDVNYQAILGRLGSLPAGPNDAVMFYYSGHGAQDEGGANFCMLPDGSRLYVSEASRVIGRRGPRLNVVVADMCSVVARPKPPQAFASPGMALPPTGIPPAYRSLFLESRGTAVIVSSSSNQVAVGDVNGIQGGIFTAAFAGYIRQNEQRRLTWQELLRGAARLTHEKFARDNPRGIDGRANNIPGIGLQQTQTPRAIRLDVALGGGGTGTGPGGPPVTPRPLAFGTAVRNNGGAGVVVTSVAPGSPAQRVGIEPGDTLLQLNGRAIRSTADFTRAVDESGPILNVLLRNFRDGKQYRTSARLNRR